MVGQRCYKDWARNAEKQIPCTKDSVNPYCNLSYCVAFLVGCILEDEMQARLYQGCLCHE